MSEVYLLLCAYGLTFGFQHKASFLRGRSGFIDRMLDCTYCTGFHAGYIVWFIHCVAMWSADLMTPFVAVGLEAILFAFASSAFSYVLDTGARCLETHSDPIEVEEESEEE